MKNIKYLQKIIEKEQGNKNSPTIVTCETLKLIFKEIFKEDRFKFHSGVIKDDKITIAGYRTFIGNPYTYFDPFFDMNDFDIVGTESNIGFSIVTKENIQKIILKSLFKHFGNTEVDNYLLDLDKYQKAISKKNESIDKNIEALLDELDKTLKAMTLEEKIEYLTSLGFKIGPVQEETNKKSDSTIKETKSDELN